MATDDKDKRDGSLGDADGAPRRTAALRGVTFLGQPSTQASSAEVYHVKRASGDVEGPYESERIKSMLRAGDLTGEEGVSRDRRLWIPILAVPEFAEYAPSGGGQTLFGALPAIGRAGGDAVESIDDDDIVSSDSGAHPGGPAPLGESGLGVAPSMTSRMASGAWATLPGGSSESPDALSGLPGVRRSAPTGELPQMEGSGELPLPRGFGGPRPTEGSGELPLPVSGRTVPLGGGLPPANLPGVTRKGAANLPAFESADLPAAREILPQSMSTARAGGSGEYASMADSNLPGVTGNLPGRGPGLPGLGGTLPGRAAELPLQASTLPEMGAAFPGRPASSGPPDLPTSRGRTSVLDELSEGDDIWADQGGVVQGGESVTEARPGAPAKLESLEDIFDDDDETWGEESAAPAGDFFATSSLSGNDPASSAAPAATPDTQEAGQAAPAQTSDAKDTAKKAKKAAKKKDPRATSSNAMPKVLALLLVVGVLVAAAIFVPRLLEKQGTTGDSPTTVVAGGSGTSSAQVDVPGLDSIRDGAGPAIAAMIDAGRRAVRTGSATPDDRALLLVGLGLVSADGLPQLELLDEIYALYEENAQVEEPSELVILGQGVAEAVNGHAAARATLARVQDEALAPTARLFEGISYVVYADGVRPPTEVDRMGSAEETPPEPAPEETSDETSAESDDGEASPPEDEQVEQAEVPAERFRVREMASPTPVDAAAVRAIDAAIAADSAYVPARYWRGAVAMRLQDVEGAARYFEQALELNPTHVASAVGSAEALLRSGRLADADGRIQRVIDEMEGASSPTERGRTFLVAAEISVARLQRELAIESLLSALHADPGNPEATAMLGEQFELAGQHLRAIEYFGSIPTASGEDAEATIAMARAQIGAGEWDDAEQRLLAGLEQHGMDARFPYFIGRVKEAQAEFDHAQERYEQSIQIDPHFLRAYVRLAQLRLRENRSSEALTLVSDAWNQGVDTAALANEIGATYMELGEVNRAVAAYRRSLEIDPSFADARLNLVDHYLSSSQHERALRELSAMVQSGVDSPRVRYLNARALTESGEHDRAIEELLVLLQADESNASYLQLMGRAHFGAGNYEAARRHFSSALENAPTLHEATYFIGRSDIELGRYTDAISSLTTVAQRSTYGAYHYWLGVALERGGQDTQALAEFGKTVDDDPGWSLENPEVFYRRARMFLRRGAYTPAYNDLRTVLTLRPNHAPARAAMGELHYDRRNYDGAISELTRAIELGAADQPKLHYLIGLSYLNGPGGARSPDALRHLESARAGGYARTRDDLHRRLAYIYRDTGRRGDAVSSFRAYLESDRLSLSERQEIENEIRRLGATP